MIAQLRALVNHCQRDDLKTVEALLVRLCNGNRNAKDMLVQLFFWWDKSSHCKGQDAGAVYKSASDWWAELALSPRQVATANTALSAVGVSVYVTHRTTKRQTTHYKMSYMAFYQALGTLLSMPLTQVVSCVEGIVPPQNADSTPTKAQEYTESYTALSSNTDSGTNTNTITDAADAEVIDRNIAAEEKALTNDSPDGEPLPDLVKRLVQVGVYEKKARELVAKYDPDRIDLVCWRIQQDGNIRNPAGYAVKALEGAFFLRDDRTGTSNASTDCPSSKYMSDVMSAGEIIAAWDNRGTAPLVQPKERVTETIQQAWAITYNQLELQLDRGSFDTWLRDAVLYDYDGQTCTVVVRNAYGRDMLQHRLYRQIQRILVDMMGGQRTEIRFALKDQLVLKPTKTEAVA